MDISGQTLLRLWKSFRTGRYNIVESYDHENRKWVNIGEFPDERAVLDSVIIGDRVYLVGGFATLENGNMALVSTMYSAQLP